MRTLAWLPVVVTLISSVASGDEVRTVDHARIRLADLVPTVPGSMADIDLGPAPPPGGSRLVGRDEMIVAIRRAGAFANITRLPVSIRAVGASRRIPSAELTAMAAAEVVKHLRTGVVLKKVEDAPDVVVAPSAKVESASVSFIPYQKGESRVTAVLELASDDVTVASVPVTIVVEVLEAGSHPDIKRGGLVNLVIERPSMRVSAPGTAAADANVGDSLVFHVAATGRTVRARVSSRDEAVVLESP
jgi:hypothetical protein